jgi:ribosomal protein S18 acetylase RimI-like enzyme
MKPYPKAFADQTTKLDGSLFNSYDAELLGQLAKNNYQVHYELTKEFAKDITKMCNEPSIKEYCPNDLARRFSSLISTERWLLKGRAVFLLLKKTDNGLNLVGYGWAGQEKSPQVLKGESTFAIRIGEAGQGNGLATPFSRLIVSASAEIFGAQNMWLETWASNGGAVHIYHKIGFKDVAAVVGSRSKANGRKVADTRLYMSLPNNLL